MFSYQSMLSFLAFSNWFSIQFGLCCSMLCIILCVTCLGLFFFFPIILSKHTRIKVSFSLLHLSRVVPVKSSVVFPSSNIRHMITIKIQTRRPAFFDSIKFFGIFFSDRKKKYLIGGGKHAITVGNLLITIDTAWAASLVKPLKRKWKKEWKTLWLELRILTSQHSYQHWLISNFKAEKHNPIPHVCHGSCMVEEWTKPTASVMQIKPVKGDCTRTPS